VLLSCRFPVGLLSVSCRSPVGLLSVSFRRFRRFRLFRRFILAQAPKCKFSERFRLTISFFPLFIAPTKQLWGLKGGGGITARSDYRDYKPTSTMSQSTKCKSTIFKKPKLSTNSKSSNVERNR
jgi:hypothetical protein